MKHQFSQPLPLISLPSFLLQQEVARLIMQNFEKELLEAGFVKLGSDSFIMKSLRRKERED